MVSPEKGKEPSMEETGRAILLVFLRRVVLEEKDLG